MQQVLIRRGAEADIYVTEWAGLKAVSKVRTQKPYRHPELDSAQRRQRTLHEAHFISAAKKTGVSTPFIYFVDPQNAEIVMEFVEGRNARDVLEPSVCRQMGSACASLHAAQIIHGDPTTSNFVIADGRLVLLDFGLAYHSERTEDAATDVRLVKEVLTSAHVALRGAFESFMEGYENAAGMKKTAEVLQTVRKIEQRGRYARVT